ncbi:trans-sialidase, putative, partial [Trypanosoma cruzi]
MPLEKQQAMAA